MTMTFLMSHSKRNESSDVCFREERGHLTCVLPYPAWDSSCVLAVTCSIKALSNNPPYSPVDFLFYLLLYSVSRFLNLFSYSLWIIQFYLLCLDCRLQSLRTHVCLPFILFTSSCLLASSFVPSQSHAFQVVYMGGAEGNNWGAGKMLGEILPQPTKARRSIYPSVALDFTPLIPRNAHRSGNRVSEWIPDSWETLAFLCVCRLEGQSICFTVFLAMNDYTSE